MYVEYANLPLSVFAGEEKMVQPEKNLLLKDKADRATDEEGGRWR
jgi:hypothetical protein